MKPALLDLRETSCAQELYASGVAFRTDKEPNKEVLFAKPLAPDLFYP